MLTVQYYSAVCVNMIGACMWITSSSYDQSYDNAPLTHDHYACMSSSTTRNA